MRVKTEQGLTESGVQNMRTELKRILAQPFFWVFLAGCLFVNGWLLCNYAGQRERVLESVSAEEELGSIDEDSMAGYEERLRRFDSDEEGVLTVGQMLRAAAAMKEELGAEDLAGVLAGAFLWMATMTAAAVLFPLGDLWDTPVGSMMMLDGMCPLISEIPMTLRTYLFAQAGISILVGLLFSFAAGWAALRTRNALTAAAGLGIVCMAVYTLAELFPGVDKVWFWIRHNPVTFAADAGRWLANGAFSLSSVWEAAAVLALWGAVATLLITWQYRKFLRADI